MSGEAAPKKGGGGGFSPSAPPPSLTTAEFREMGIFFKRLIEETPLAKCIVLAGIGAAAELLHILWLAARFLLKA